jgi:hypothetical protein
MNIPKAKKPPRRFVPPGARPPGSGHPQGHYSRSLWGSPKFAKLFGESVAYWPHVEDDMIELFHDLMGGKSAPARQIFKAIFSNASRKLIMLACLHESRINATKGQLYDQLIEDFSILNTKRNTLIHGLWFTHDETGRVFLSEESTDDYHYMNAREVELSELERFNNDMMALVVKIENRHAPNWTVAPTSPEKLSPQRQRVNKKAFRQAKIAKR